MTRKQEQNRPTEAELAILSALWKRGPATVRELHDELGASRDWAYTTVLKLLQIMFEKGLVRRSESARAHVYEAAHTQGNMLDDLVDRAFGGSMKQLMVQALASAKATPEELAEVRRMLEEADK